MKHRFFGKNIKVVVIDDGVETKHEDLVDNYVSDNDDNYSGEENIPASRI